LCIPLFIARQRPHFSIYNVFLPGACPGFGTARCAPVAHKHRHTCSVPSPHRGPFGQGRLAGAAPGQATVLLPEASSPEAVGLMPSDNSELCNHGQRNGRKKRGHFYGAPGMGDSLAVKVRYGLGSGNH